ncbi:LysE family translocator [Marimonas sp. MJW-29]|uniref:LysE family translocator n=1 Tax=Sulfitobacter sediminis TaxID=3234186 RepID=A0ABV3RMA7_9RHOB
MIDPLLYLAFLPAALALVLTPGPDMLFAMAQGLRGGRMPAIAAAAGISVGAFTNAALAGLGMGALVAAAPWLFGVIRWVGVAYLVWLAIKTLRNPLIGEHGRSVRPSRAFRDGLVVNLSNPSVILFILAFIPQFVDPAQPILPQFLIYGGTIAALGFVVKSLVGISAGGLGRRLARNPRIERALRWTTASIFGALAARVALTGGRA